MFHVFGTLDEGISYTYLKVSYDDQVKANEVLGKLIVKGGQNYSQKDILHILRQEYPEGFIVEEGSTISMGQNYFEFDHDRLVKVR